MIGLDSWCIFLKFVYIYILHSTYWTISCIIFWGKLLADLFSVHVSLEHPSAFRSTDLYFELEGTALAALQTASQRVALPSRMPVHITAGRRRWGTTLEEKAQSKVRDFKRYIVNISTFQCVFYYFGMNCCKNCLIFKIFKLCLEFLFCCKIKKNVV